MEEGVRQGDDRGRAGGWCMQFGGRMVLGEWGGCQKVHRI